MTTPDRFDALYECYCDGLLTAEERTEFLAALETPEGRARFVELSTFAAVVGDEVRLMILPREEKPSSKRLPAVRGRRARRRSPAATAPATVLAIAAALLVGVVILVASLSTGPRPAPPPRQEPPVADRPRVVEPPRPPEEPRPAPRPPEPLPPRLERRDPEPFVSPPPRPVEDVKPPETPNVPPEPPKPAPKPVEATVAVVATVETVAGKVSAAAGKGLRAGEGLETGPDGYALVRMGDGTKVELGGSTAIARVAERSVQLERGLIAVEAARQPAGKPLVFGTPHAEAAVLGTEFTLYTTPAFTRLDVREGRVKFTRLPGVSSVVVGAGQFALAGQGEFAARTNWPAWKAPAQNLLLWLKTDALQRARIEQWSDASGNGLHAAQTVAAAQPSLVPNAWAGRAAVRFDGTDDHLELPAGFQDFRAGLSVFVVARVPDQPAWMRFIDLGKAPQCDNIFFGRKDAGPNLAFWVYANNVTRGKVDAPGTIMIDQVQSLAAVMSPAGKVVLYRNGVAAGSGSTSTPATVVRKPNYVGRSNYGGADATLKGDLFEVLLFNRAISDAERSYIESYLSLKFLDPTAPPALARPSEK